MVTLFTNLSSSQNHASQLRDRSNNKGLRLYSVASMFSGCGGLDLGFQGDFCVRGRKYEPHPFKIIWANDINEAACRTYRRNIGDHIIQRDVWEAMDTFPNELDVLIGGFPCQDISINGKGAGVNGKRSGLYRVMVDVIKRTKPKVFVAENVKGLLMRNMQMSGKT
jgi:DNA (cytosine-5)-methyltransferase 1